MTEFLQSLPVLSPHVGPFEHARVKRFVLEQIADVVPRRTGAAEAAFSLGCAMAASHWSTEDVVEFVEHVFAAAGAQRSAVSGAARAGAESARANGYDTSGLRTFAALCRGSREDIGFVCGMLLTHIPGLQANVLRRAL